MLKYRLLLSPVFHLNWRNAKYTFKSYLDELTKSRKYFSLNHLPHMNCIILFLDDRDKWQLKYDITMFVSFASNYDEAVLE